MGTSQRRTEREAHTDRRAGTGITAFGLVLAVIGAIMRYAVTVRTAGFNIHMAGVILIIVGVVALIAGMVIFALGGRRRSLTHDTVTQTPHGSERVEQEDTWSTL